MLSIDLLVWISGCRENRPDCASGRPAGRRDHVVSISAGNFDSYQLYIVKYECLKSQLVAYSSFQEKLV